MNYQLISFELFLFKDENYDTANPLIIGLNIDFEPR